MDTLKQKEIAKHVNTSAGHLSRVLRGLKRCGPDLAGELGILTRTPLDIWLFNSKKNTINRQEAIAKLKKNSVFVSLLKGNP